MAPCNPYVDARRPSADLRRLGMCGIQAVRALLLMAVWLSLRLPVEKVGKDTLSELPFVSDNNDEGSEP